MLISLLALLHCLFIAGTSGQQLEPLPQQRQFPNESLRGLSPLYQRSNYPESFDRNPPDKFEPKFLVIAPSQVRPGQVYRVIVTLVTALSPLEFVATVQRDGQEVAGGKEAVSPGESKVILIQVPLQARPGDYRLLVHGSPNGVLGGGIVHTSQLKFSERFLTILIQTNQLVYNMLQTIRIRVVLLNTKMKPFTDPIDIFLLDSRGYVVKRWVSVYPFQGLVSLLFQLPGDFPKGWWTIRVMALHQKEEKRILLERWFTDQFDVSVFLPAFIEIEDKVIRGQVTANYTNFLPVEANATISVRVKEPLVRFWPLSQSLNGGQRFSKPPTLIKEMTVKYFKGSFDFEMDTNELLKLSFPINPVGKEIEFKVTIIDPFYGTKVIGFATTRVINSTITLRFLDDQPAVFKPGMPFRTHLRVSYNDHLPLPPQKLLGSTLEVSTSFRVKQEELSFQDLQKINIDSNGVAKLDIIVPDNVDKFNLKARYRDGVTQLFADLIAVAAYSEKRKYLHITTSTEIGMPGEYAILHVRANFYMTSFDYIVISKGDILVTGTETVKGMIKSVTTFAVALSMEMAPNCRIVVYHVTSEGEMLADRVDLPVQGIGRTPMSLKVNTKQERSGTLIELIPAYGIGSIIGMSAIDENVYDVQGYNDIKLGTATDALYAFMDEAYKKITIRNKYGMADKVLYYGQSDSGWDAEETLTFAGISFATTLKTSITINSCSSLYNYTYNSNIQISPPVQQSGYPFQPNYPQSGQNQTVGSGGFYRCVSDLRCYPAFLRCDGKRDCNDGSDEKDCWDIVDDTAEVLDFLLNRRNRNYYFYHATGEDFAWQDTYTSYNVDNYVGITVPSRATNWVLNSIGLTMEDGFSAMESMTYQATKPFFITVEAPNVVAMGEQVGIRVALFNNQEFEILVDVILEKSLDYCFVEVGELGRVSSYSPRLICETIQHLVHIQPSETRLVHMPVVPTVKGKIKVELIARTQVALESQTVEMEVIADGALVSVHTSILLDMRNQALLLKYLNINVTDDPVIPFREERRFVYGSPEADLTVIGDVVGAPTFDEENIVTFASLAIGKPAESGELFMFNFAYHFLSLQYLRITSQITNKQTKQWLQLLNKDYVNQLAYFSKSVNGFTMFGDTGSVWLSAYCAKIYYQAQYPEWENYLFIDPKLVEDSLRYVFNYQFENGSFYEPRKQNASYRYTPVALTSHVLISLAKIKTVSGSVGTELSLRKKKAVTYLEHQLPYLQSPFEVAIATYALMEAPSVEAKVGLDKLETMKRELEEMIYWSPMKLAKPAIKYQNQRPYIEPRLPERFDSEAIEASAYALMVYTRFEGLIQDKIVTFLNYARLHSDGFVATYDTIIAMEALTDYSFRTHIRTITDITLDLEFATHPNDPHQCKVTKNELAKQTRLTIPPPVYGHVMVTAQGAGYAVVQLDTRYRVDRKYLLLKSEVPAFDLDVRFEESGRNKSSLHYTACARWLLSREYPTSDTAILEVDIPTGYYQNKAVIDEYVASKKVPNLKAGKVMPKMAVFMFDFLTYAPTCINFTVDRWFPVANGTRYLKAKLYDLNRPGLFVEQLLDNLVIHLLNICEVCGSYQCPYCPFFSSAFMPSSSFTLSIFLLFLLTFYRRMYFSND